MSLWSVPMSRWRAPMSLCTSSASLWPPRSLWDDGPPPTPSSRGIPPSSLGWILPMSLGWILPRSLGCTPLKSRGWVSRFRSRCIPRSRWLVKCSNALLSARLCPVIQGKYYQIFHHYSTFLSEVITVYTSRTINWRAMTLWLYHIR